MYAGSATIDISAPPERVWALVADVTRMGEWSPECLRCEWLDGASGPAVGARFRGYSRWRGARWYRDCEITAYEPESAFAFHTFAGGKESTRWRYVFEPTETGTRVTESFEIVFMPLYVRLMYAMPHPRKLRLRDIRRGMERTLARVKEAAERA